MQFIFAYNYLDNKDNRLQKAWVYFDWIERAFLRSPLNDVFVGIFWKVIFFLVQEYKLNVNYLVAHLTLQNACMRCMPIITRVEIDQEAIVSIGPIEFAFRNVYKCVIIFGVRGKPGKDLYQYSI